jgi:hypothetical protein
MTFFQQFHVRTATTRGSNKSSSSKRGTKRRRFFLFGKKAEPEEEEPAFDTIGGVYSNDTFSFTSTSHSKSLRSIDTQATASSHDSSSHSSATGSSTPTYGTWISSGSRGHHKGSPLVAKRALGTQRGLLVPEDDDEDEQDVLDQAEALGQIMLRARQLPNDSWEYASNHIMINAERTKRMISPLVRARVLDSLARAQAADMASSNRLYYSDPSDLQLDMIDEPPARRLGENVTRGSTLKNIHHAMMDSAADKNNILDRRFTHMGMGTAKASDGTLYLCQLFRG